LTGFDFFAVARAGEFFDSFFADAAGNLSETAGLDADDDLRRASD
jgi:hypothetical protein